MEISLLVKSFVGLVSILGVLLFFLIYSAKQKKKLLKKPKITEVQRKRVDDYASLEELLCIIKDRASTTQELSDAVSLVLKHHGTIHPKLGARAHPDFNIYGEMLLRICRHPNTSKNLIINFEKSLGAKNEAYKRDINDFVMKGLNSRGA